jgi:hypothetical protein
MGKIIFWLVVFFVVLLVLRLINVANSRNRQREDARPAKGSGEKPMTQCVECGVYLPTADAKTGPRGPLCGDAQCAKRRQEARR